MKELTILFGSQTGNAKDVAERISREARDYGLPTKCAAMDAYSVQKLPSQSHIIFIASTTGQGEHPSNMSHFWRFLLRKSLPADSLKDCNFAVFGLGDSGYLDYNVVAKRLDRRLTGLGAKEIVPRGLGDDQHPFGYEAALDTWLKSLWATLRPQIETSTSASMDGNGVCTAQGIPKFSVRVRPQSELEEAWNEPLINAQMRAARAAHQFSQLESISSGIDSNQEESADKNAWGPGNPAVATVKENIRLTSEDHFQDTRHIAFELGPESGPQYEPGDILTIWPRQDSSAVNKMLSLYGLRPEAVLEVKLVDVQNSSSGNTSLQARAEDFIQGVLDVAGSSPRRYFFELLYKFATNSVQKERLEHFASIEGKEDLGLYCSSEGRTVLEVLEDFDSAKLPLEWLLESCPRLQPRQFSIASSQAFYPKEAHICLAAVKYRTPYKRLKEGVCSRWLLALHIGDQIPVWVDRGVLRLPKDARRPIVMIGPGTGVAPFRAFAQELLARNPQGLAAAPCHLYFGCRSERKDFYYKDEWREMQAKGILAKEGGLVCAFSRDQDRKVYVTQKLQDNAKQLWSLISQGAAIFVCGSAKKMPAQVATTLQVHVMEGVGQLSKQDTTQLLKQLRAKGLYCVEAWS